VERSGRGLILSNYPGIRLEGQRKTELGTSLIRSRNVNHSTTTFGNIISYASENSEQFLSLLILWGVTSCGLIGRCERFEETRCHVSPEDGGSIFLRNTGIYLQAHTTLQPRRQTSMFLPPRQPQISRTVTHFCPNTHLRINFIYCHGDMFKRL
jgi:hypothetical protein